jgi:hypothetical protein
MAQTIAEYLMEQGALGASRWILREILKDKHGNLPKTILDRIAACNDFQRLRQAILSTRTLANAKNLEL